MKRSVIIGLSVGGSILLVAIVVAVIVVAIGKKKKEEAALMRELADLEAEQKMIGETAAASQAQIVEAQAEITSVLETKPELNALLVAANQAVQSAGLRKTPNGKYFVTHHGGCTSTTGACSFAGIETVGEAVEKCAELTNLGGHGPCKGVAPHDQGCGGSSKTKFSGCLGLGTSGSHKAYRLATPAEVRGYEAAVKLAGEHAKRMAKNDLRLKTNEAAVAAAQKLLIKAQAQAKATQAKIDVVQAELDE